MAKNVLLAIAVLLVCDVVFAQVVKAVLPPPLRVQQEMERVFRLENAVYHHDLAKNAAAQGAWGDRSYPIFTNSLGFKDRRVRDVPLQSDAWRILVIGDSFTEGIGVVHEATFAGLLEEAYRARGIEVLNAAVASYSPSIYYRKVKYLVEDVGLDFDELVVFIDISDIDDEANDYALDAHDRVVTATTAQAPEAPASDGGWKSALKESSVLVRLADLGKDALRGRSDWHRLMAETDLPAQLRTSQRAAWTVDPQKLDAYGRRGLARAIDRMNRLLAVLRSRGKPLTVVVYPWPTQLVAGDRDSIQSRTWRAWCAEHDVAFIDLFPVFFGERERDPLETLEAYYIPGDNHFNEAGHALVARTLIERFVPAHPQPPD